MKRTNNRLVRLLASISIVALACTTFLPAAGTELSHAAGWLSFSKYSPAPRPTMLTTGIDTGKFYSGQGVAFDTFTGKDGYYFALSSDKKKVAVTWFQQGTSPLKTKSIKRVTYSAKQLGHCNGATVYKKGSAKYLFVAKGGAGNKTACMIKLSDFNKGKAKVYKVTFKKLDARSGTDLRGITYCGVRKVKAGKKKVKKPVFVVEVGRRMNMVYLSSLKSTSATFVKVDSQRFAAPKTGKREGTAQGVTYHNGFLYMPYGDEGKGGNSRIGYVDRVKMSTLFKGNKPNVAKKFSQHWKITSSTEYVPEAIYFTSLNKKGRMYMTTNDFPKGRGGRVSYSYKTGTETVEVPGDAAAAGAGNQSGDQSGTSNDPGTENVSTPIAEALDSTTIRLNLNQIEDGDKYKYIIMSAGSEAVSNANEEDWKTPEEGEDSVVFDGLTPNTAYEIWKRDVATGADSKIDGIVVSTPKEKWAAPAAAPTATAISSTSIEAGRIAESENFIVEYSIDNGENWVTPGENEDSVIFGGLTPNKNYQVICRIAGNEQYDPSDASPAASVTTNKIVTRAVYKTVNGSDNPDWIYESQQLF